jgi:protein-tyrosine kinase
LGKISDALEKFEAERSSGGERHRRVPPSQGSAPSAPSSDLTEPIPPKDLRLDNNLIVYSNPTSYEAEQFRILRSMLLFPSSGTPPRTIMVTSCLPGEGKSFVASNLAVSLAQNINEHVLLIDSDIRLPCLHTRFGFGAVDGLSEYLSKKVPLSSLLLKTMLPKLSLLPAGTPPPNPSELLSSKAMSDLIQEVRTRYGDRYIVIDTPPPSFTAEAVVLAQQVDGVILVINSESTSRKIVEKLIEPIGKEKILGIVMNRYDMRGSKYYGYGKYVDYAGYGKKN